ncbi:MAG: hypothetical protein U0L83_06855 [Muribaculaceae bacterium]|nr:hypothetical protein [Muribaculaceae bacterium]
MKEIGGYFELELRQHDEFMHSDGILLNSGRHALEYIIKTRMELPVAVWVPDYTCNVVLQPLQRLGVKVKRYKISADLDFEFFEIGKGEIIIVNNYFGIKDSFIKAAFGYYGENMIADNSQAWYSPHIPGASEFYSPRKFFGLPDGGVAYCNEDKSVALSKDISFGRCSHLLERLDGETSLGYKTFKENSSILSNEELKGMSRLTKALLSSVDFEAVRSVRRRNYDYLRRNLQSSNILETPSVTDIECPMVYPYRTKDSLLRKRLIDNKVFVATYWPDVSNHKLSDSESEQLSDEIIPLPIDQRYGEVDMQRIVSIIS